MVESETFRSRRRRIISEDKNSAEQRSENRMLTARSVESYVSNDRQFTGQGIVSCALYPPNALTTNRGLVTRDLLGHARLYNL